jgi:DNA anti-recombination protein RmuC
LEGYGTLFRLLEEQRAALLNQDAARILEISAELEQHAAALNQLRKQRESELQALAPQPPPPVTLGQFIQRVTHEAKPLLEELLREINRLIAESKRQLTRNQMLYRRAWDLGQEMLRVIQPGAENGRVYRRDGYTKKHTGAVRAGYTQLA